jgi:hypothetical protein
MANNSNSNQPLENHLRNHGQETPLSQHTACQYTWRTTDQTQPVNNRCMRPSIMMPGYKRACALHIADVLLDSIEQYISVVRPPHELQQLAPLVAALLEYTRRETPTRTPAKWL